ncbi:pilus assembly protein PilP [Volucribacter psittacicida]|uniref:Pilus assembly protein PilP n=1 Tax=Volucribacter psittacicida TaxID=203482 RepID=A0A4R1FTT9_9PAST|nr:pilus assembly protein PilP [Volucribacter psittacicida]TCJ94691.1 pilus assembly protein PilP [Volucribacter psittacicida]
MFKARFLLLILPLSLFAQAFSDPFNNTGSATPPPHNLAHLNCHKQQRIIAEHIPFVDIRFVGMIQRGENRLILFSEPTQQVFQAKQGDFISQQRLQIQQISAQHIQLFDWQQSLSCEQPKTLFIHF